jgi:hypothetical protein
MNADFQATSFESLDSAYSDENSQALLDTFFGAGSLTVYATASPSWRWRACGSGHAVEAVLIDPVTLIEIGDVELPPPSNKKKSPRERKAFENHTLVKWLTRATNKSPANLPPDKETIVHNDMDAYAALVGMDPGEWRILGLKPAISAAHIRLFAQGHNAALSDIESAFLPGKFDMPPALATFYIRHLTQARRDAEATLLVAQSCGSTRIPEIIAHAFAVFSFEAAGIEPVQFEANEYAGSAVRDTSAYIDAAVAYAAQKLALHADHPDHLLRMNLKRITEAASDIVERLRPPPFAFLLKAKELYLARSDVTRFPPQQRFLTALSEGDLPMSESWVRRLITAYETLFEGHDAGLVAKQPPEEENKVLRFR